MIIRPGGAALFLADRQTNGLTGMPQLMVDVGSFAKTPLTETPITPRVSVLSVLACKSSLIMRAKTKFKGHVVLVLC
jgi:hypothetical protein